MGTLELKQFTLYDLEDLLKEAKIDIIPDTEYTITLDQKDPNAFGFNFLKDGLFSTDPRAPLALPIVVKGQDLFRYTIRAGDAGRFTGESNNRHADLKITTKKRTYQVSLEASKPGDYKGNTPPNITVKGTLKVGENSVLPLLKYSDANGDPLRYCGVAIYNTPEVKLTFGGQILNLSEGRFSSKQLQKLSINVPKGTPFVKVLVTAVDDWQGTNDAFANLLVR